VKKGAAGITWRSVSLGLFLAFALCAITPYNDYVIVNTYIAGNHFPVGAVFVLFALGLLNVVAYRMRGSPLLAGREVAVVYIITMVTSGISSSGLLRYLITVLGVPYYYASPGNRWETLFWDHVPPWMWLSDPAAVTWFWQGLPEGVGVPWAAWAYPLSRWTVFVGAVWLMMICLAALVRKQWADRERLAFPLVQFPVEVLRAEGQAPSVPFFSNRLVWIGAAGVFLLHAINGLHQHFPAIPSVPTFWDFNSQLTDRPWRGMVPLYIGLFPSAVGFSYLLPLEVAAGFWVAVLFTKGQAVVMQLVGYEGSSWWGVVQQVEQWEQMGAVIAIAALLLWLLRGSLADAFRKAFSRAPEVDDSGEPLSYRAAVLGFLLSLAVMAGWLHAAGMTWTYLLAFLAAFIAMCLVLTRIVAEAGMLMIHYSFRPTDYLLLFGGPAVVGVRNLVPLSFVDCALTFDLREFLMPSVLNAFRLADYTGLPSRGVTRLLALALPLALGVSIIAFLWTIYQDGAAQISGWNVLAFHPRRFFNMLGGHLDNPTRPAGTAFLGLLAGGGLVAALAWLRLHFVWWPVHPLGFAMASSWASVNLWFSLFLGWLFKLLIIRYTGLRGYVGFRPLFMGVILGDILGAVLWIVVGWLTGVGIMVTVN
jgi:hypothetical protein